MKTKGAKGDSGRYTISQMCERTGYTADTLRFYEKLGLLPGVKRKAGRRVYSDDNIRAIRFINCLKRTGMQLLDVAEFMRLVAKGDKTIPRRLEMIRRQAAAVRKQQEEIEDVAAHIAFKVWFYETAQKEGTAALGDHAAIGERYFRETGRKIDM